MFQTMCPSAFGGLNKGFGSKFCVGSEFDMKHQKKAEEYIGPNIEYNNEDEDNSPNTLSDKND